jgi:16S rRNA (cytidine1402-2'-O)-methyltransferase
MASGRLYIVATPIGNLQDINARAIDVLKQVDLILAEDTRHSSKLLQHLSIQKPCQSFHAFNEQGKTATIIDRLLQGQSIALISDAGTPLISDPGFPLVTKAQNANIEVVPIPGPCALITALCASGLSCERFIFEGFLPAKQSARRNQLATLKEEVRTLVFYESSHRIKTSIKDIESFFPAREMVLAKELTKQYETLLKGQPSQILAWLESEPKHEKGEFVLVIAGNDKEPDNHKPLTQTLAVLLEELSVKQAAKLAAKICNSNKNQAYQIALSLKNK